MILDDWTNGSQSGARRKTRDQRRNDLQKMTTTEIEKFAKTRYGLVLTNDNKDDLITELLNKTI